MENILISGFERQPNKDDTMQDNNITAKLGDLGIVMSPLKGIVQPIAYRAPEVYFRREITPAADIWSWGLIYCQLLEAQAAFHKTGMYDDLLKGSFVQAEKSVQKAMFNDYDLGSLDYYDGCALPYLERDDREGKHWDRLKNKGVPENEINFLSWVLNPVPTERPTAQDILDGGWLTPGRDEASGFTRPPKARAEKVRKRSEPSLFAQFYDTVTKKSRGSVETDPSKPTPWSVEAHAPSTPQQFRQTSRPSTPRSSSTKTSGGSTFLNYGALMK